MSDFQTWLAHRIDAQSLTPELERTLRAEWEAQQPVPQADILLVPVECRWPQRFYRCEPVGQ